MVTDLLVFLLFFYNGFYLALFIWSEWLQCQKTKERTGPDFIYYEYFLYRVDYHFSRNPKMQGLSIGVVAMLIILIGGFSWSTGTGESMFESMWIAWTFIADPGTHAGYDGTLKRIISLSLTLGGMCIFAVVIGTISDSISTAVDNLRKGKSRVIESHHTLIIGQGDKLIPTIHQIALANASCAGGIIVVLTVSDKEELEHIIRDANLNMHGTEVIVRTGSPHIESDLRKVSAAGARSIIVLADRNMSSSDMADVNTVRTVLSLRAMQAPRTGHIVAEVCDVDDDELVHLVGQKSVETLVSHDIIGRLMIQCALEPGLAPVLETLLGFEDNEFYFNDCADWPELVGLRFDQLMFRFEDAIVIGFLRNGKDQKKVELNPSGESKFESGDSLVVIAEDDDTYKPSPKEAALSKKRITKIFQPEKVGLNPRVKMLFVGWRRDMDDMIKQLDELVPEGSQLSIFSTLTLETREERLTQGGMKLKSCRPPESAPGLAKSKHSKKLNRPASFDRMPVTNILDDLNHEKHNNCPSDVVVTDEKSHFLETKGHHIEMHMKLDNLEVYQIIGNQTKKEDLEDVPLETYDSILILADEDLEKSENHMDMVQTDSRSLTTLLLIRSMQQDRLKGVQDVEPTVISEILDPRTKSLLHTTEVSDYVTSNELVSMAIAMVAEQRDVNKVLQELFSSDGNLILVRPMTDYVKQGETACFWEIMWIAKSRHDLAIGYKSEGKVHLNPGDKAELRVWSPDDELVILRLKPKPTKTRNHGNSTP